MGCSQWSVAGGCTSQRGRKMERDPETEAERGRARGRCVRGQSTPSFSLGRCEYLRGGGRRGGGQMEEERPGLGRQARTTLGDTGGAAPSSHAGEGSGVSPREVRWGRVWGGNSS